MDVVSARYPRSFDRVRFEILGGNSLLQDLPPLPGLIRIYAFRTDVGEYRNDFKKGGSKDDASKRKWRD